MSEAIEVAFSPLVGAADMAWNTLGGWMFIPLEAYCALKVSTCYLFPLSGFETSCSHNFPLVGDHAVVLLCDG